MVTIKNKTTDLNLTENQKLTFFDLYKTALKQPPQGGFGLDEMRKGIKLLDAMDKDNETAKVENVEFEYLKEKVNSAKWGSVEKVIIEATDYLNNLKSE